MAELITVLTDEDVIPKTFTASFVGPLTRAKIMTAVASDLPFMRNTMFAIRTASSGYLVFYGIDTDEYWYEEMTKAT